MGCITSAVVEVVGFGGENGDVVIHICRAQSFFFFLRACAKPTASEPLGAVFNGIPLADYNGF